MFATAQEAAAKAADALSRLTTALVQKDLPAIADLAAQAQSMLSEVTASFPHLSEEAVESMDAAQLLLAEGRTDLGRLTVACESTLQQVRTWLRDGVRIDITSSGPGKTRISVSRRPMEEAM